jgi:poly-beta-1,6-N-acetyl-D-glucosamine synthase
MMGARLFWFSACMIAYTYAGYPLLVTLLARTRPRPRWQPGALPSVTLLVAAYNEEAVIARKLENALALDYPEDRLQILVADDGSTDRTAEIVRGYVRYGVASNRGPERRGKMAAINRAMGDARGEVVVFSDASILYDRASLRDLVAPFSDPHVGAVIGARHILGGDGALGASEGLYWKYENFLKEQETRLGSTTGISGDILAIRRNLFEPPPDYVINDDFYMAMKVMRRGYRVVYEPQARAYDRVSASAQEEVERRARIVAGRYQAITLAHTWLPLRNPLLAWQVLSHKLLRPLVPLAMVGAIIGTVMAVREPARGSRWSLRNLGPPLNWLALLAQGLFYALAASGYKGNRGGTAGKLLYLPVFLVNSNVAAAIGLYRFLTQRQSTLWRRVQQRREQGE